VKEREHEMSRMKPLSCSRAADRGQAEVELHHEIEEIEVVMMMKKENGCESARIRNPVRIKKVLVRYSV
jgi:hypothetical protein